jgi:hypothetical protein
MDRDVCWHAGAWIDVLNLRPSREVAQAAVLAEIERWAMVLSAWNERDTDQIGDLPWGWLLPEARMFSVQLPDGVAWGFHDLRLFCLDGEPASRVCIVAVHPDGRRYLEGNFGDLLKRMEDVRGQHSEAEP